MQRFSLRSLAVHIAAAEGNLVALKVLVEFGADLLVWLVLRRSMMVAVVLPVVGSE